MSNNISFREFMQKVEEHLNTYSYDMLCEIVMQWAKDTHPSKRSEFLANLVPQIPEYKNESTEDKKLLEEITELKKKVEDGDYCNGWGWDEEIHEERDWGDESWADEIDEFFSRAHKVMKTGRYRLAKEAYVLLFDILDLGEEAGHLPGNPNVEEMLSTDIGEAQASYLRSVYLSTASGERPVKLLESMQRFSYRIGDNFNLQSIINVEIDPLPDFSQFLPAWIDLLKRKKESYLLREAVMLSGGIPAIRELARREGKCYPSAYVDWIKALEKESDFHSMIKAAEEGLTKVPKDCTVRAKIAEGMSRAGELLNDIDIQLIGWREAFYSDPSLSSLLCFLFIAKKKNCYEKEIEMAIKRIASLLEKETRCQEVSFIKDVDAGMSSASENLLTQAYLLAGRYEDAFKLCDNREALGWSYGHNPKGLVIPFFLKLFSKKKNSYSASNIEQLWEDVVDTVNRYDYDGQNVKGRFQQAMDRVFQSIKLSEQEESNYMKWCIKQTGQRVDAIVGSKHRKSYHKVADLIVAVAEVLANRNKKIEAADLIEKYRQKYHRHSAFKQELNVAIERSCIFKN